jgi:thioredoxin reductase (NADPH)
MSVIKTRGHQLFPVLDASQIDTAKRFASGPARNFAPGEIVFDVSERNAPAWLVLKGSIDVVRRDGLNHEAAITSLGSGQFSGEVSQLAGAATLASARAGPEGCAAIRRRPRARPDDRLGRGGRDHDASVHPSPRRAH